MGLVSTMSSPQMGEGEGEDSKADTKIGASYSGLEKLASNVSTTH